MALQSLLNDPNISLFLQKIPQKQQIITLKQLIYIGIKIVSDSFNKKQTNSQSQFVKKKNYQNYVDKQNNNSNRLDYQQQKQLKQKNKKSSLRRNTSQANSNYQKNNQKGQSPHQIQSTLLRQISKIRVQLQSLTNKVYDHCFQNNKNENQYDYEEQNSFHPKANEQQNYIGYGYDMPTFSPPKNNKFQRNNNNKGKFNTNPFSKQKNNFFVTDPNQNNQHQSNRQSQYNNQYKNKKIQKPNQHQFVQRNRAKSNIMHMDDTQIRQALYKQDSDLDQNDFGSRTKKSQSLIQKKHQQKKKDQQNYFYNLAVDKQRVEQLQKIKKVKQASPPQRDIDNNNGKSASQLNLYKKKVKSKIKKLVERDRLRYQEKMEQYNFKKGFEQYQYSANQLDQDQKNQQDEHSGQNQQEIQAQDNRRSLKNKHFQSPEVQYCQERQSQNPNFGFYSSQQHASPASIQQNTFSNNQNMQQDDDINIGSNSSSFSQFSMSGSSRREVGKISRRKQQ